ncbi:DUF4358 domain-containing protein [Clostridium sp. Cult2]|uniref:DUF4358 domain-containing protein n=1 Tax=Clostridium sp. Cult2 TaxID=2079003 RepID=UPI001F1A86BE|nr:DUF4358 domain-containing protein [Clostridium sp. Cult2]
MIRKRYKNMFYGIILCSLILFVLTSCSSKSSTDDNLSVKDIDDKIKESINLSNMELGDSDRLEKLYDIDNDDLEEFILYTPKTNIQANEIAIFKVKDSKEIDDITEKITERIEVQSTNFKDYLPEEYYLIENHVLKAKGNFILYAISEEVETIEEIFDESIN